MAHMIAPAAELVLDQKVPLLDGKGFVMLRDYMGTDLRIVEAARTSYTADGSKKKWRKIEGLIQLLVRNRHTSPLEHVQFTFVALAPIFVLRHWHRHRTWSYSEWSARFTTLPTEFWTPYPEDLRVPHPSNKQMSVEGTVEGADALIWEWQQLGAEVARFYRKLSAKGVANEQARSVLPVGTYSLMYCTVDLHNLLHFIGLRNAPDAQPETKVYAQALLDLARTVVPVTIDAYERHVAKAARFGDVEANLLRELAARHPESVRELSAHLQGTTKAEWLAKLGMEDVA